MSTSTTKLQDLNLKVTLFSKTHDAIDRAGRGDKIKGVMDLITTLESAGENNMITDKFLEEFRKFKGSVVGVGRDFLTKYNAFKVWADKERKNGRSYVSKEEYESASKQTYDTISVLTTYKDKRLNEHADKQQQQQYSPYQNMYGVAQSPNRVKDRIRDAFGSLRRKLERINDDQSFVGRSSVDFNEKMSNVSASFDRLSDNDTIDRNKDIIDGLVDIKESIKACLNDLKTQEISRFDPNKSGPDDFVRYQETPGESPPWMQREHHMSDPELFSKTLQINRMYDFMGAPLKAVVEDSTKNVVAMIRSLPVDSTIPGNVERKRDLESLQSMLERLTVNLMLAPLSGKKSAELDELTRLLAGRADMLLSSEKVTIKNQRPSSSSSPYGGNFQSSSSSPGGDPTSTADGFLFRRLEKPRLKAYYQQLQSFQRAVEEEKILDQVTQHTKRLSGRIKELESRLQEMDAAGDPVARDMMRRQMGVAKASAMKAYCRTVRGTIGNYVAMHANFVNRRHRDAIDFVNYWDNASNTGALKDDDAKENIKQYQELRKHVVEQAKNKLVSEVSSAIRRAFATGNGTEGSTDATNISMGDQEAAEVDEAFTHLLMWIGEKAERIDLLYMSGSTSLIESATEPHFVILYVLKVVRILVAWYALRVAGNVFQSMYSTAVYTRDMDAPTTTQFIGMFMAVDLAFNLLIAAVLVFCKHIFKSVDNEFPVDSHLMSAWALDYGLSSVVIFVLSYIIGQVVENKRYFRYKFEGDRGIRAMQQMVMYVYMVVMFIPFFRMTNG